MTFLDGGDPKTEAPRCSPESMLSSVGPKSALMGTHSRIWDRCRAVSADPLVSEPPRIWQSGLSKNLHYQWYGQSKRTASPRTILSSLSMYHLGISGASSLGSVRNAVNRSC